MRSLKPIKIIASGKYLPEPVSSEILELKNEKVPQGFSEKYSGVKNRHQATFETIGYMGARATEAALANAGLQLSDIDLLISASATFDYPLPSQASVLKSELHGGLSAHFPTMDINSTCLSFVSAFEVAAKMLDGRQYKNIVIASSEIASKGLNTNTPETYTLFGDGAVAFILNYDEASKSTFAGAYFRTYSEGVKLATIKGGGNIHHPKHTPYDEALHSFDMHGFEMLKLAKKYLPDFMKEMLSYLSIELSGLDIIIPHQASKIGIHLFEKTFEILDNKVKSNLENYGNCIAASIPLLLHDTIASGDLKRGNTCLLIGTSAGFSIGSLVFTY